MASAACALIRPWTHTMEPLVSVSWLRNNINRADLVLLEAGLPSAVSGGAAPFLEGEGIPGSTYVDLNKYFVDENQQLPHMLASPETFARNAREFGINQGDTIIVFDKFGIYASPRLRLAFRAMGHDKVAVLDGGLPAWHSSHAEFPPHLVKRQVPGNFVANFRPAVFCDAEFVQESIQLQKSMVVDARSPGRFAGKTPEPRAGLRGGHIPGAVNMPFEAVLNKGVMRSASELKGLFTDLISLNRDLIFSCGSGVTACIPALAAELIGLENIRIYDGSWSEWGARADLPIEVD